MKRRKGFSLPEIMVAAAVIAIGIIPVFFMFSRGTTGTVQTKDEIIAYQYASELLSFAQAKEYDDPFLGPGKRPQGDLNLVPLNGSPITLKIDPDFSRSLSVSEVKPDPALDWPFSYKVLTSEVSWKSGGVPRKIQLAVLIYQKGS